MEESSRYLALGASATKDDVKKAVKAQSKGEYPGAFCKLIADRHIDGASDAVCAFHADGAGTKSALAYIKYRETGDASVFSGIAVDSAVMNLDDLLCIGATDGFVMSNTIGRNAHLVGGAAVSAVIEGYERFVEKMAAYGIGITMSGGETADVGDLVRTIIVDSTFYVKLRREDVVDASNIAPGDIIVGLASFGRAPWEDAPYNAGMGSNGLTAARHMLLSHVYAEKYPESYSPTVDPAAVYTGKYLITDRLDGAPEGVTVGDAILSPTRTYAPVIAAVLASRRADIHGIIHCTGGAQTKCLGFGQPGNLYIKDNLFPTPPLFAALADAGVMNGAELYRVFNMGSRMELYVRSAAAADDIISISRTLGVDARIIGRVEKNSDGKTSLRLKNPDTGEIYSY